MAKATKLTTPTMYRGYILRPRQDGSMDMIDPLTGMWASFPTQRYAKWSATFITNIHNRFTAQPPLLHSDIPQVQGEQS